MQLKRLQLFSLFHLNLMFSSIDEDQYPTVINNCYWPFLRMIQRLRLPLSVEASGCTLEIIQELAPHWLVEFRNLCQGGICEFIGSGYAQIIGPLVPAQVNQANLRIGNETYQRLLGFQPKIALVNEQAYSAGLIQHYLDAGYEAIIMEWDNPASQRPEWNSEWRYLPQIALGQQGERIPVIWNKSVAFQKFQRLAHAEMESNEYLSYLESHLSEQPRAFSLYGNDIEIFDFRPGRFETEAPLSADSEWSHIENLLVHLKADERFRFIKPREVLHLLSQPEAGKLLHLETADQPIPVKKQEKYNIIRWAVTGRNDFNINTACWRIFNALRSNQAANDHDWRELCYLWSSDFRTHITEKRWAVYLERLFNNRMLQIPLSRPKSELSETTKVNWRRDDSKISREGRYITIENDWLILRLNCRRGLALDTFIDKRLSNISLCGTLHHGYYDDIKWSADYYTGHLIFDSPGRAKITDLNPVEPETCRVDDDLLIKALVRTNLGPITKDWVVGLEPGQLSFSYALDWQIPVIGSLRLGHITLNPDAFEKEGLFYRTHNGGNAIETFNLGKNSVDHGRSVSFLVSASHAIGITEGIVELGNSHRKLAAQVDNTSAALVGLINYYLMRDHYFYRLAFTCREVDDTSRPFPIGKINCRIHLRAAAGTD